MVLAVVCGCFGYVIGLLFDLSTAGQHVIILLTVFGVFVGGSVGLLLSSIINSATAMVFVAFAEDPEALKVCFIF